MGQAPATAAGLAAKPILLCLPGNGPGPAWVGELAASNAFIVVEARDPARVAELARACRPDLLLICAGLFATPPRAGGEARLPPLVPGRLPLVLIEPLQGAAPAAALPNLQDVLQTDLPIEQMVIRLRAVLRRARPTALTGRMAWHGLELRHDERRVLAMGHPVHLGPSEFNVLALLLERPGQAWTRGELLAGVWGPRARVGASALEVLMRRLRRQLAPPLGQDPIEVVRGIGYRLV